MEKMTLSKFRPIVAMAIYNPMPKDRPVMASAAR